MSSKCTVKDCEKLYDSTDKWKVSVLAGAIFMLMSSPFLYTILSNIGLDVVQGTYLGLFITTVLFVLVVRLLLR